MIIWKMIAGKVDFQLTLSIFESLLKTNFSDLMSAVILIETKSIVAERQKFESKIKFDIIGDK